MAETLTLDRAAPIVPGVGAAGLTLGTRVDALPSAFLAQFRAERLINTCIQAPTGVIRYRADAVEFWATDGVIDQVAVRVGYQGTLGERVQPGTSVHDLEATYGPLTEDDEDNLVLPQFVGLAFDVEAPTGHVRSGSDGATIAAILVYRPSGD